MRKLYVLIVVAILFVLQGAAQTGAQGELKGKGTVIIRAARIIDGRGGEPLLHGAIVVHDDKIVAVGPLAAITVPAGSRMIDLGDATLMPGFYRFAYAHNRSRTR